MKHILVTGSTGFIGKNTVLGLRGRYSVFAPTHQELDLLDTPKLGEYITKHRIDTIIHAATAVKVAYFEPTVRMFRSILTYSPHMERVIYFGTGAEYDKFRDLKYTKETEFGKQLPSDPNGLSKYINSLLTAKEKNFIILRPFGLYGPYEDYLMKFISNAIVKHILGIPITIKQDVLFHYVYIDDLVTIVKKFLESPVTSGTYNVTPDHEIYLSEIAKLINQVGRKELPITIATPGLNFQYTGSNVKLKKLFPDLRFISYEEGIGKLYAYYKKRRNTLDESGMRKDEYMDIAMIRSHN